MRLLLPPALCLLALAGLKADVIISEFLADNINGIKDENDSHQDWIELYNPGAAAVSLDGWWLTDNLGQTARWQFPNVSIPAGGTLLVWASGKDRRVAGQALHTNFSLAKSGEYLGLYQPAAGTGLPELVDHFEPAYPEQAPDISYGVSISQSTATLVASNSAARYKVLTNDAIGAANYTGSDYGAGHVGTGLSGGWNVSPAFVDSSWTACTTGLGYDTGNGLDPWIVSDCEAGFRKRPRRNAPSWAAIRSGIRSRFLVCAAWCCGSARRFSRARISASWWRRDRGGGASTVWLGKWPAGCRRWVSRWILRSSCRGIFSTIAKPSSSS